MITRLVAILTVFSLVVGATLVARTGTVKIPTRIKGSRPAVPYFRATEITGTVVIVQVNIDVNGKVTKAEIVKSAEKTFDESVLSATKDWQYTSTKLNGLPVSAVMQVTFSFKPVR